MRVISTESFVSVQHVEEANAVYRRIRDLHLNHRQIESDSVISKYEPAIVRVDGQTYLAGKRTTQPVFATIFDAFIAHRNLFLSSQYVFRGHRISNWDLLATKQRLRTEFGKRYYNDLEAHFIRAVKPIFGNGFSTLAYDALCQHYGLITNLLDLTEHFEVAAFFAERTSDVIKEDERVGCIWVFDRASLELSGQFIDHRGVPHFDTQNQRLIRQRGCFLRIDTNSEIVDFSCVAKAILFNQATELRGDFFIGSRHVTSTFLFPPDEDDRIAQLARCYRDRSRELLIDHLERCFVAYDQAGTRFNTQQMVHDKRFLAPGSSLREMLYQSGYFPGRELIIEELIRANQISRIRDFLEYCGTLGAKLGDKEFHRAVLSEPWNELLIEYTLQKSDTLPELSEEDIEAAWDLIYWFVQNDTTRQCFIEKLLKRMESPESGIYSKRFVSQRVKLLTGLVPSLERSLMGALPVESLKKWYWIEENPSIQRTLYSAIGKLHEHREVKYWIESLGGSGGLETWPPPLPRLPRVSPLWGFPIGGTSIVAMEPESRLIAAASHSHDLYLLNYNGKRLARFELPNSCLELIFIDKTRLAASDNNGSVYLLSIEHIDKGQTKLCLSREIAIVGNLHETLHSFVTFDVSHDRKTLLAGYRAKNRLDAMNSLALFTIDGDLIWKKSTKAALRSVKFIHRSPSEPDDQPIAVITTINIMDTSDRNRFTMDGWYLYRDGDIRHLLSGKMVWISGISSDMGLPLLSVCRDDRSCALELLSLDGNILQSFEIDGISLNSYYSERDDIVLSAVIPTDLDPSRSSSSVNAWNASGKPRWTQEFAIQALGLCVDRTRGLLFVTALGQGNLYALSMKGKLQACGRVSGSGVGVNNIQLDPKADVLIMGLQELAAFPISGFLRRPMWQPWLRRRS